MDDIDRKLIDACNLICAFAQANIKSGYQIVLTMNQQESFLSLEDENGDDVEFTVDRGVSSIREACGVSWEHAAKD